LSQFNLHLLLKKKSINQFRNDGFIFFCEFCNPVELVYQSFIGNVLCCFAGAGINRFIRSFSPPLTVSLRSPLR
jgi:hypothetical protein